ncbi:uncharacterized protein LOC109862161 [Pseudomyrmex gracilis]|uniref:uncharacterized protein LOC109862161 n=1 Tax=Pseudomyrmex gracilis TaxID=219809 RepID=UPI000994CBA7|nr:uncharacterized protein LOC109862161 [Pseudomyrmex gracilis]
MVPMKQRQPSIDLQHEPQRNGAKRKKFNQGQCNGVQSTSITPNVPPQRTRILSRKYILTKTGYKYFELGIGISLMDATPTVDIALGDNNGNEVLLSSEMWKMLLDNERIIMSYLSEQSDAQPPILVDDLVVLFSLINNAKIMRLTTKNSRIILSHQSMCNLFNLKHCVACIIAYLNDAVIRVRNRLSQYFAIQSELSDSASFANAVAQSGDFDVNDIVDCKLLAVCYGVAP